MRDFLLAAGVFFLLLAAASWGTVECLARSWGEAYRLPLSWGCLGGFAVNAAALPFIVKLAGLGREQVRAGAVWTWFLLGFLARLGVLLGAYLLLRQRLVELQRQAGNALIAVYFAGLMFEVFWLNRRISSTDVK